MLYAFAQNDIMHLMLHPGRGKPFTMTIASRISEKMLEYQNPTMVLLRPRQDGYVPHLGEGEYHTGNTCRAFGSWCPLFCLNGGEINEERMDRHSSALRFLLEEFLTISFSNKYTNTQILEMSFVTSLTRIIFWFCSLNLWKILE